MRIKRDNMKYSYRKFKVIIKKLTKERQSIKPLFVLWEQHVILCLWNIKIGCVINLKISDKYKAG